MAESKVQLGTFEELIDITQDAMRPVAERLREIILGIHPEACEVVRLGDRAATYGVGPKKMSEGYAYILPHSKWVNLGFYKGIDLDDPAGLLEGTGAKMRHVKIRSIDDADRPAVRALLVAAVRERSRALGRS